MDNKYTPATIGNMRFRIPLYQRLFEWDKEQIEQLLRDLKSAKEQSKEQYYIGMFTTKQENDILDLVDGQQRFTVLMLLGIVFEWKDFLLVDNKPRLSFFARIKDEEYLTSKINNKDFGYSNKKMENGIRVIEQFLDKESSETSDFNKYDFAEYIYEHLAFFVSELPPQYDMVDLNKYFESMNATGKGLESHEILEVRLLKELDASFNKDNYTRIWNCVSQMDKQLVRQRTHRNESVDSYNDRFLKAICAAKVRSDIFGERGKCLINDLYKEESSIPKDEKCFKSIKEIQETSQKPTQQMRSEGDRSFMNFSEFLLQVLFLTLSKEQREQVTVTDFFDVHKLLTTFEMYEKIINIPTFFDNLLIYRLLFDYFIIRIKNDDGTYLLKNIKDNDIEQKERLMQYQSMLYVSSSSLSYHKWLSPLLITLYENHNLCSNELLSRLKDNDNERHKLDLLKKNSNEEYYLDELDVIFNKLSYKNCDRYWFWRLDYYLWENRNEHFLDQKQRDIAEKYIFRRNRSIEHVAPQNPKHDAADSLKWDVDNPQDIAIRDCFGNLCMVSGGQNSSLSNESFKVKRAYVESFIDGDKTGSIESLKLLKVLQYKHWDKEKSIREHGEAMLKILRDSFLTPTNS